MSSVMGVYTSGGVKIVMRNPKYSKDQQTLRRFLSTYTKKLSEHIRKEKDKVQWLFDHYPTTVQSNHYLRTYYRRVFGDTTNKESTLNRVGRKLRELCRTHRCDHPDPSLCYIMDEEHTMKAVEQEQTWREEMRT